MMNRRWLGAGLLVAALVVLPSVDVYAQKKKKDGPKKSDVPVDSAKLSGEFVGTLKTVPGTDRLFTVDTETKQLVPTGRGVNPRGNTNAARIIQLQNQIARTQAHLQTARTPQQRAQQMRHLQQQQLQLQQAIARLQLQGATGGAGKDGAPAGYKYDTKKQTIEFQAAETVKVRTMVLPEQFDEKGLLKKYTKKELDELKGKDKSAPGYESSLEKLEVGQKVRVVLAPAAKKPAPKDKDKDKDEEVNDADKRMQVKLIVILEESTGAPPARGKGKAKKAK
jgi:hypothetical protein